MKTQNERYKSVLIFPFLYVITDIAIRLDLLFLYSFKQLFFYILSISCFLCFYFLIIHIFEFLRNHSWLKRMVCISISFYLSVALLGSYTFYFFNGFFPNFYTYEYFKNEPLSAFTLLRDSINSLDILLFLAGFVFIYFYLTKMTKEFKLTYYITKFYIIFPLFVMLLIFLTANVKKYDQCYIVDTNFTTAILRHLSEQSNQKSYSGKGLQARHPIPLSITNEKRDFNVIVLICESLRKQNLSIYGYRRKTTPNLELFQKKHPKHFFVFHNPYAVSTTTMLAVPAILSGIAPYQSAELFYKQPTLWELAKKVNYETFLISSHTFKWYHFDRFYDQNPPDYLWGKDNAPYPFFNDLGIDDSHTIKHVIKHIQKLADLPFFGIIQLNGTHYPYHVPPSFEKWSETFVDTYDNSILYQDEMIGKLFNYLNQSGKLSNTVIFITGDHGESLKEHHNIGHVDNNYLQTISIPLLVYMPDKIKCKINLEQFIRNTNQAVSTIDIAPTIIDLLELCEKDDIKQIKSNFTGYSLLQHIPTDRSVITLSNNDIAKFHVGVSIISNKYHFLRRLNIVPHRNELYHIQKDPEEKHNLIHQISKSKLQHLMRPIYHYPISKRYLLK